MREEPTWRRYLRFWGTDPSGDVDDEVTFHQEMRIEDLRRMGLSESEALQQATREFGDVERIRRQMTVIGERRMTRARRMQSFSDLISDAHYALRSLWKNAGFASVAVLTLALAIAANTAIFSTLDAVLFRPLPYHAPADLIVFWNHYQDAGRVTLAPAEVADLEGAVPGITSWAALSYREANVSGNGDPVHTAALDVTPNFFETLGVRAVRGRTFTTIANASQRDVMLSYEMWSSRFARSPKAVGSTIHIDNEPYTIVGVLPANFEIVNPAGFMLPHQPSLFFASNFHAPAGATRGDKYLRVIGRRIPGVNNIMNATSIVSQNMRKAYPDQYPAGWSIEAVSLNDQTMSAMRATLVLVAIIVGLVLLIACINVANLVLARTLGRSQEIAVRSSLGATRARITRQLIAENMVLALVAGLLGTGAAVGAVRIASTIQIASIPRLSAVRMDGRVMAVAAAITLLAGIGLGIAAAMSSSTRGIQQRLRTAGRGVVGSGAKGRAVLVVTEISLTCLVLVGTASALAGLLRLSRVQTGFDPSNVTALDLSLPTERYATGEQQTLLYNTVVTAARAVPGIRNAAVGNPLPLSGDSWNASFSVQGAVQAEGERAPSASISAVTAEYFKTMGIRVLAGRSFDEGDRAGTTAVVVVDSALAMKYWPRESALGRRIHVGGSGDTTFASVVGVAATIRTVSLEGSEKPQMYLPLAQRPRSSATLIVATDRALNETEVAASIREALRRIDPDLPVARPRTLSRVIAEVTAPKRYTADLVTAFGVVALVLASVGLYGVVAYGVSQRTREIGVRMALGARDTDVLLMVLREGGGVTLTGIGVGLGVAAIAARALEPRSPGLSTPWYLLVAVGVLLFVTGMIATYLPARRAARTQPLEALVAP